jgi:hypothetical protein
VCTLATASDIDCQVAGTLSGVLLIRLAIKLAVNNNIVDLPDCHTVASASGPPTEVAAAAAGRPAARTPALPRPVAAGLPLGAWALSLRCRWHWRCAEPRWASPFLAGS